MARMTSFDPQTDCCLGCEQEFQTEEEWDGSAWIDMPIIGDPNGDGTGYCCIECRDEHSGVAPVEEEELAHV